MSDDLIKRSDAIKALGNEPMVWTLEDEYTMGQRSQWRADVTAIESIPQGESILQDTIRRLERVIKHGVAGKDGMHPVSAEVVLNWLKGADDEA